MQNDLRAYVDFILRRKWLFLATFLSVIAASWFYLSSKPDQYKSFAVFQYEKKQPIKLLLVSDEKVLNTLSSTFTSGQLIKRISNDTVLFERVLGRLQEKFPEFEKVEPAGLSNMYRYIPETEHDVLIRVEFVSNDPEISFSAVSFFVEEFMKIEEERDRAVIEKAKAEIYSIMEKKRAQLKELNTTLAELQDSDSGLSDNANSQDNRDEIKSSTRGAEMRARLARVRNDLYLVERSRDSIRSYNESRVNLASLESQLRRMRIKFTDENPTVRRLEEQISTLKDELQVHEEKLGRALVLDEPELKREYAKLQEIVDRQSGVIGRNEKFVSSEERQILSEIDIKRDELLNLSRKIDDISVIETTLGGFVKVLWKPDEIDNPIGENPMKSIPLIIALGIFAGIVVCTTIEQLDDHVLNSTEIERLAGIQSIVDVPNNKTKFGDALSIHKGGMEPFFQIATYIRAGNPDLESHIVFVTSCQPEEGKTTLASGLAIAFSGTQKTLLVDCDFRNPNIGLFFQTKKSSGIMAALFEDTSPVDVITPSLFSDLDILTCEESISNPSNIFYSDRFRKIIEELAGIYSVIVIDTPPVSIAPDVFALGTMGYSGLLAVDVQQCRKSLVMKTVKYLHTFKVHMMGIILNKVSSDIRYSYYKKSSHYSNNVNNKTKSSPVANIRNIIS